MSGLSIYLYIISCNWSVARKQFVNSVMQEVIQERKACRNVFEVMDFICIDYDVYLKNRLVSLACVRSTYRNSFGLKKMNVSAGIIEIRRLGQSTFVLVQEEQGEDGDIIVETTSGACSHWERTKFCTHVSTIACLYPESMVRVRMGCIVSIICIMNCTHTSM